MYNRVFLLHHFFECTDLAHSISLLTAQGRGVIAEANTQECHRFCSVFTMLLSYLVIKDLSPTKVVLNSRSRYLFHFFGINHLCGFTSFAHAFTLKADLAWLQSPESSVLLKQATGEEKTDKLRISGGDFNDFWDLMQKSCSYVQKCSPKCPLSGKCPDIPINLAFPLLLFFLTINHIELHIEQEEVSKSIHLGRMFFSETM